MNTKEQYQKAYSLIRKMVRQGHKPIHAAVVRPSGMTLDVMVKANQSFKNA